LGPADVAAGERQRKVGQIICVFVRNPAYRQGERDNGGKDQPPVSERPGRARIARHCRQSQLVFARAGSQGESGS
jgi:hypothetical protein